MPSTRTLALSSHFDSITNLVKMSLVDPASFTDGDILCQTCENIAFLFATKQRRKSTDG